MKNIYIKTVSAFGLVSTNNFAKSECTCLICDMMCEKNKELG